MKILVWLTAVILSGLWLVAALLPAVMAFDSPQSEGNFPLFLMVMGFYFGPPVLMFWLAGWISRRMQ